MEIWCHQNRRGGTDQPQKNTGFKTLRIHGTGIFVYIWLIFMVNVGKYPTDPMGKDSN